MPEDIDPELEELRKKRREMYVKQADEEKQRFGWPDTPMVLTDANFRETVALYPLMLVDLWAPWCGPCKMLGPVIEQLARELKGKVVFGKLNVDENPQTASSFKVMSIPTMLVIKERELVDRITGAVPKATILQKLQRFL
ncbi:MAG: thioredoxin [Candidatus Thermoplasmatota archaeon]|jgi:thioredoxin 1|nr:thioredoxin [Candidatus Thermoplasmatota archaeon]